MYSLKAQFWLSCNRSKTLLYTIAATPKTIFLDRLLEHITLMNSLKDTHFLYVFAGQCRSVINKNIDALDCEQALTFAHKDMLMQNTYTVAS